MSKEMEQYIKENFPKTVRISREDKGTLLALPYPYTVPSTDSYFQEMYYWDTFFTNLGLARIGMWDQCINNTENLLYQVEKYGYVLNGNRTYYLRSSQTPYLSLMVRHCYEHTKDQGWLEKALPALEKEYQFWMTERTDETGLAHYGCGDLSQVDLKKEAAAFIDRLHLEMEIQDDEVFLEGFLRKIYSCCESGWDFSTRFDLRAEDFIAVDLNCLLYCYEKNFAYFENEVVTDRGAEWEEKAWRRRQSMIRYCRREDGVFFDYDRVKRVRSDAVSCAAFYPYLAGIETEKQGIEQILCALERQNGVVSTEREGYQWDNQNIWAPLQWAACQALKRMGEYEAEQRIREKYMTVAEEIFRQTGLLFEKYPASGVDIRKIVNENDIGNACVPLQDWSAGVYMDFSAESEL